MALTAKKSKFVDQYVDPVGKSVPRIEGSGIVTGQLKYVFDVQMANMLVGKMLRSPHAHARIISIDTSNAEALPGVKAIVTAQTPMKLNSVLMNISSRTPLTKWPWNHLKYAISAMKLPLSQPL